MLGENTVRKLGIEVFYWLANWSDDQTGVFARAKANGCDVVEVSLIDGGDTDTARFRSELDRYELDVCCSLGLPADKDITAADEATRRAGIAYLKQCVDAAVRLGSPILGGLPHVPWLQFPTEHDLRPYRERSANAMREVASYASDRGVTLCVEIINRFETYIFNTVAEALDYLALVDHPNLKLQLDTYHMNMEEDDLAAAIVAAGAKLGHFHCADSNRRLPGGGHIQWSPIKAALDQVGYVGPLVMETFPNPNAETGRAVNVWRPLADDYDGELRAALALLRSQVA